MQQDATTEGPSAVYRFRTAWSQRFGTLLPFSCILRERSRHPWIRLHALPGSHRYTSNDGERAEILRRAYILGDEVLGEDAACWLVESHWPWTDEERRPDGNAYEQTDDDEPASTVWHNHVMLVRWTRGSFDALLQSIADDGSGPAIWMACESGAVFAPYDGGFYLFPPSWNDVVKLRINHSEWLPQTPSGLSGC